MLRFPIFVRAYAAACALALLLSSAPARAQAPDARPLRLVVFGDLPREALRSRLEKELGRPVTLAPNDAPERAEGAFVTVAWRNAELAVSYDEPGRGTLGRVIAARASGDANVEDAVLLASSLVHDEASELLGGRTPSAAPSAPPPAAPTVPAPPAPAPAPATATAAPRDFVPAYASLLHPLATNFDHAWATTRFGLDVIYGRAGELDGGVQLGTINAILGKPGVATGAMAGLQLAPLGFNYVSGHAAGVQIGLAGNAVGDETEGAQIALGANVAVGGLRGVQIALVNVAGDVKGAQIGLVNVGRKVDGVMLGLLNYADDVDGAPIGIVSVTRTGGIHPVVWGGTTTYANVGLKLATKHTYTMVAAHSTWLGSADYPATVDHPAIHLDARSFVGGGAFVGGHVPFDDAFVDFDLGFSALAAPTRSVRVAPDGAAQAYHEVLLEPRVRLLAGYSFADHASVFIGLAGVGRVHLVNDGDDALVHVGPEFFGGVQF